LSLEAILEAVHAEGKAQIRQIEAKAKEEISNILGKAKDEADCIQEAVRRETLAKVVGERTRILNRARFEALCLVGAAQEELVDDVLSAVTKRLATWREHANYPQVLKCLLAEAMECFREKEAHIEADERDRHILEKLANELKLDHPVEYNLTCWGGLIVRSQDERVKVINTFESRLERARPQLRQHLRILIEDLIENSESYAQLTANEQILSSEER
jgi:vacuolar-type H+-ATPase subunit E/Vma4